MTRALRYLAPNMITAIGILFGLLSLEASFRGDFEVAAWFIVYAVLTDKLDGFVARLVRGASELGVQLDSLADFLNFGLALAVLVVAALGDAPELPFADGAGRVLLLVSCATWVLAACFRLARYNISTEEEGKPNIFFGVPTTLAAGVLVIWFLLLAKYSPPGGVVAAIASDETRLLGSWHTPDAAWRYAPIAMFVGAFLMASSLRIPKLGLARSRTATVFIFANVLAGYVFGFARMYPDYVMFPPTIWMVMFIVWGQVSPTARKMRPPPIFPRTDPQPGMAPLRPEDDLLEDDEVHDELAF